jgi:hypothetical protein
LAPAGALVVAGLLSGVMSLADDRPPEGARQTSGVAKMTEHSLFYYPYASFTNQQLPLLKVAALYFDKLTILDPVGASWDTIGADFVARDAVRLLKEAGILEVVTPSAVLARYEAPLADAIRHDMADREFLELCEIHAQESGRQRWTLALSKVPRDLQTDQTMRHLMGDFARDLSAMAGQFSERAAGDYRAYAEGGQAYDEYREGYESGVEYRYADYPLALGEAIMLNHALFTGLLHASATPLTDEPFHGRLLDLKMRRARDIPALRQVLEDRARRSQIKAADLAVTALQDGRLKLPALNPGLGLEDILEYRRKHADALGEVRETLGIMAQQIKTEPWTAAFRDELEHDALAKLRQQLRDVRKARDSWRRSKRARLALGAAGIGVAAATVVLGLVVAPLTPVALATAGLSLASGVAIPGAEWLLDWRDGKQAVQENGLHYLVEC